MRGVAELMGLAEAAALMKVPYQDAHRLLLTGRLSGRKEGGRWVVAREQVELLVKQRDHVAKSGGGQEAGSDANDQ